MSARRRRRRRKTCIFTIQFSSSCYRLYFQFYNSWLIVYFFRQQGCMYLYVLFANCEKIFFQGQLSYVHCFAARFSYKCVFLICKLSTADTTLCISPHRIYLICVLFPILCHFTNGILYRKPLFFRFSCALLLFANKAKLFRQQKKKTAKRKTRKQFIFVDLVGMCVQERKGELRLTEMHSVCLTRSPRPPLLISSCTH